MTGFCALTKELSLQGHPYPPTGIYLQVLEVFTFAVSTENSMRLILKCICGVFYYSQGWYVLLLHCDFLIHIYISILISLSLYLLFMQKGYLIKNTIPPTHTDQSNLAL